MVGSDAILTVDWGDVVAFNKLGFTAEKFVDVMQEAATEIAEIKNMLKP